MENLKLNDILLNEYLKLSSFKDKKEFLVAFYNSLKCDCYTLEYAIFSDNNLTRLETGKLDDILDYQVIALDIALELFKKRSEEVLNNENAE